MALLEAADLAAFAALKAEFDEGAHPRDEHGRFADSGGGESRIGQMIRGDANRDKLIGAMRVGTTGLRANSPFAATETERQQAKSEIVAARGADLARAARDNPAVSGEMRAQYPATEDGRALLERDYQDTYQGPFPVVEGKSDEQLYGELKAQEYIDRWAETASDDDRTSQALQLATADVLDAHSAGFDAYIDPYRAANNDAELRPATPDGVLDREGNTMRAFVGAEYNATQSYLRDAGIGPSDSVSLYRGMAFYENDKPLWSADGVQDVQLNPASSWSLEKTAAQFSFALQEDQTSNAFVLSAQVKASDIISTARTGRGALTEGEVVVRNQPGMTAYVERVSQGYYNS